MKIHSSIQTRSQRPVKTPATNAGEEPTPKWIQDQVQMSTRRAAIASAGVGLLGGGVIGAMTGLGLVPTVMTSLASGAMIGGVGLKLAQVHGTHRAEQLLGRHQEAVEAQLGSGDFEVKDHGLARTYVNEERLVVDFKPSGTIAVVDGVGEKKRYQVEAEGYGTGRFLAEWNKEVPPTSMEILDQFGESQEKAPNNSDRAQLARTVTLDDSVLKLSNVRYDRKIGAGMDVDETYDLRTGDIESDWISIKNGKTERYDIDWQRVVGFYANPANAPRRHTPREDRYEGAGTYTSKFDNYSSVHKEALELEPEIFGPVQSWSRNTKES